MSDSFALKKLKDEARDTLRKAIVLYLDLLEEMGTSLGGPTEDFYADNCTVPVCDFWHGSERFEISVGPLELVEGCRSPEKSQAIAAWKEGEFDSIEAWDLYATERKILDHGSVTEGK
jgi:hypothetical protein